MNGTFKKKSKFYRILKYVLIDNYSSLVKSYKYQIINYKYYNKL